MSVFRVGTNKSSVNNFPSIRPTLDLDFANSKTLDPRITFTRSSGGSYIGADGLIKYARVNEARFDHDPITGESLGLLIEEASTNTELNSGDTFLWPVKPNMVPTGNAIVLPDGSISTTVEYRGETTEPNNKLLHPGPSGSAVVAGDVWTFSVFVRAGTERTIHIVLQNNTGGDSIGSTFDMVTGQFSSGFSGLNAANGRRGVQYFGNGWYRIWLTNTYTTDATGGQQTFIRLFANSTSIARTTSFAAWGAQLEKTAYPTSYIPTQGSTRTRRQDFPKIIGKDFTDFYNPIEGSISITSSTYTNGLPYLNTLTFTDGSLVNLNNSIEIALTSSSFNTNVGRLTIRSNGRTEADVNVGGIGLNLQPNKKYKMIASYKKNDFTFSVDGITYFTDTSGDLPVNISGLLIGHRIASASILNGSVSRLTYFPKRLPNSQLQALTR